MTQQAAQDQIEKAKAKDFLIDFIHDNLGLTTTNAIKSISNVDVITTAKIVKNRIQLEVPVDQIAEELKTQIDLS